MRDDSSSSSLWYGTGEGQYLKFQWDSRKAASNVSKHKVSFDEALTAFADPLARIFDDEEHSISERRELIVGHSDRGRLLIVCFSACEDTVRIFSARRAVRRERQDYEENVHT